MNKTVKEMMRANEEAEKSIKKENEDIYRDMVVYLRVSSLSEYYQEVVRGDIIEMLVSGQERGETIEQVIGDDYKAFCDDIIAALPKRSKRDAAAELLDILLGALPCLGLISIIFKIADNIGEGTAWYRYSLSAADVVIFAVFVAAAYGIVCWIGRTALGEQAKYSKIKIAVLGIVTICILAGICIATRLYLSQPVLTFHVGIAATVVIITYVLYRRRTEA